MKRSFRLSDSRPDPKGDVRDEIDFHLDMRAREFAERGMPADQAQTAASAAFGDVAEIERELRAGRDDRNRERARRESWRGFIFDARFALRTLRKQWGFTASAALTLALGIGSTASVFTIVNGVLLRPLPYADPERTAMLWTGGAGMRGTNEVWPLSSGLYIVARDESKSFESLAAFRSWAYSLGDEHEPERIAAARARPALFSILGARPLLGRVFTDAETVPGGPAVVVLSYDLWQRRFGGARDIVGRSITLSGERFTVVGVMPPGFTFPRGAELPSALSFPPRTELWTPLVFSERDLQNYGTQNLSAVGRLRSGITVAQAQQDLDGLMRRTLVRLGAPKMQLFYRAVSLEEQAAAPVRRGLLILLGAVAFVLLIACANVANLLVARTTARSRELAVRTALGAGRGRIIRQLITENVILAVVGGGLGVVIAIWGTRFMLALVPGSLPRADDVAVDWRVLVVALGLALGAGTVFGIITALHATRGGVGGVLQGVTGRTTGSVQRRTGRRLLVAVEVALSLVLLIGAGLLVGSFARLQRVDPGFDPSNTLTASVALPIPGDWNPQRDGPRWSEFFTQLMTRLGGLPGVVAAGGVSSLPLSGLLESGGFMVEGRSDPGPGQRPSAEYSVVSGDYFRALGIRLAEGRAFDSRDRATSVAVVIVNRELAQKHFPGESPIGKRLIPNFDFTGAPREIVGVIENIKQTSLDATPVPAVYVPQTQMPYPGATVLLRTNGDPLAMLPAVRAELRALDPTLALSDIRTMDDVFAESLARQRFSMIVLGVFATAALLLALVGLYGVIALSVGQRTREIGVRLALGAQPRDVVRMVVGEGMRVTALGVLAGLAAAFALTRVMRTLLYDVSATDAATFGAAAVLIAAVSFFATYVPARRATRVDPTVALRDA